MSPSRFLLDTSALVRILRDRDARGRWEQQITSGLLALCPIVELEFLFTARSVADRDELVELLGSAFAWVPMPDHVFNRAADMQMFLTQHGHHRSAGAVDLLVAATAELSRLTLLHYDQDFDQIVTVTGQAAVWLAPPGSIN